MLDADFGNVVPWAAARVESAESTPNVAANPAIMPGSTSQEREGRREGGRD